MARLSVKYLKQLTESTSENLKRVGITEFFSLSAACEPPVYTLHNMKSNIACIGSLKECEMFLRGINWLVSNNLYQIPKEDIWDIDEKTGRVDY